MGFCVVGDSPGRFAENGLAFGSRNSEVQALVFLGLDLGFWSEGQRFRPEGC